MNRGQLPTNQLHDINWGTLDHASCAPQLISCNYTMCVHVCVLNQIMLSYIDIETRWLIVRPKRIMLNKEVQAKFVFPSCVHM